MGIPECFPVYEHGRIFALELNEVQELDPVTLKWLPKKRISVSLF